MSDDVALPTHATREAGVPDGWRLDPVLLIADEPTTALDVTTQAQILKLVLDLQRRHGAGVLFITHDFGVVAEVAHRVAVLRLGDMVEIGPKADVLQRPQHDYTRMLIGAVPTLHLKERPSDPNAPLVLQVKGLEKTYRDRSWFVAMVALAGGLAFGLGGKEAAADLIREIRTDVRLKK
jgi:ABC-type glutathione transport system ATPase component